MRASLPTDPHSCRRGAAAALAVKSPCTPVLPCEDGALREQRRGGGGAGAHRHADALRVQRRGRRRDCLRRGTGRRSAVLRQWRVQAAVPQRILRAEGAARPRAVRRRRGVQRPMIIFLLSSASYRPYMVPKKALLLPMKLSSTNSPDGWYNPLRFELPSLDSQLRDEQFFQINQILSGDFLSRLRGTFM